MHSSAEDRGWRDLVARDAEHLAEQQRVDRGCVLVAEAQEQRAEAEHHHERERGRDVVAAAAAEQPIPSAPASENTPSPSSVLTPIRLAPAAPAKEPLGIAWAANAEPRRTVKNPTTPATTATMLATFQALTMKPRTRLPALGDVARATGTGGSPRRRRSPLGQPREQVEDEHEGHHEEAHRPAVPGGRPVVAVVGEHDPEPHRATPIPAAASIATSGRLVRRSALAAGPMSSAVQRIVPIVIAASAVASASASR